jgi:hypothetical protein
MCPAPFDHYEEPRNSRGVLLATARPFPFLFIRRRELWGPPSDAVNLKMKIVFI